MQLATEQQLTGLWNFCCFVYLPLSRDLYCGTVDQVPVVTGSAMMGPIRSNQLLPVTVVLLGLSLIRTVHSEKSTGLFQIDLMQTWSHEKSPYAEANLSLKDRVTRAVRNSQNRAMSFNERIVSTIHSKGKTKYEEPLRSNQGDYLTELQLGSPPQAKILSADTGSDLFWVQCKCISCYSQPGLPYDPSLSSTFQSEKCNSSLCMDLRSVENCTSSSGCEYFYSYGDGSSTQGFLASDSLTLGSSNFEVGFGCGQTNQGSFEGSDGLVGLGRGPLSIISQIGTNFGNVFSYCLVDFYSDPTVTSPLIFGKAGGNYSYTPLIDNPLYYTFYYVKLCGILVNGIPLSIPPGTFDIYSNGTGGIILDSGTTITQLQTAAFVPLLNEVQSLITYTQINGSSVALAACYRPDVIIPSWPTITFQFEELEITLPDENVFLLVDNEGDYCMAIQDSGSAFLGIYGNVQQQNFNIQYDIPNGRVGFSGPTNCG